MEGITEKDRYICSHSEQQIHRSLSLSPRSTIAISRCRTQLEAAEPQFCGPRGHVETDRANARCPFARELYHRWESIPSFFFFFLFFWIFLVNVNIGNISRLNDLESLSYFSLFKYNIASINIFMVRKFFEISKKSFSRQNLLRKWSK